MFSLSLKSTAHKMMYVHHIAWFKPPWTSDCWGSGSARLQVLQDAWSQCAGIWKQSQLYKKIVERKKTTAHGARLWLTRGQLVEKYRSQQMADVICDGKLADEELKKTHTKRHPDCPEDAPEDQVEARYQIDRRYI